MFTTRVSDDLEPGSQYLTVDIENIFRSRAIVEMLPISLQVSSTTVVPNQEVWVTGRGFTSDPSGNRKLDKSKCSGRIDGLQALAMAFGQASKEEPQGDLEGFISNPIMVGV